MPLTDTQKDHLIRRDELPIAIKKNNEFAIRKGLEKFLKSVNDAWFILLLLPKKQIKRFLKDEDVYSLLKLAEKAMEILEFAPIEGDRPEDWRVTTVSVDDETNERTWNKPRPANDRDIERSVKMDYYISQLGKYSSGRDPAAWAYRWIVAEANHPEKAKKYIDDEDREAMERVAKVFPISKPEEEPHK